MRRSVRVLGAVVVLVLGAAAANAQATRTWVSGVGDDANPCSRTAPCKTFAGAISKTAAGGEINVLDPGGFGSVTITKSITISSEGFEAGVLVAGTNAIVINAGVNDFVVLRGLDIEGLGTGLNGINFLAGKTLSVEDCTINRFATNGISFTPSAAASLHVRNTIIRHNNIGAATAGIKIRSSVNGVLSTAQIDNVQFDNNKIGLLVENTADVQVTNSRIADSILQGVNASEANVGFIPELTFSDSAFLGNVTAFRVNAGAKAFISGVAVNSNGTAFNITATGAGGVVSSVNNTIAGNGAGEPPLAGYTTSPLE